MPHAIVELQRYGYSMKKTCIQQQDSISWVSYIWALLDKTARLQACYFRFEVTDSLFLLLVLDLHRIVVSWVTKAA